LKAWFRPGHEPRRSAAGHWIPAGAVVPGLRVASAEARLEVGRDARILGDVECAGPVVLTSGVHVLGGVRSGHSVVVGPGCTIDGPCVAAGAVVLQDRARVLEVKAGADVQLLGAPTVGDVEAAGDIIVAGSPSTGRLSPKGRLVTRAY
jgi:predicted acyltransferase (DUF342 family)